MNIIKLFIGVILILPQFSYASKIQHDTSKLSLDFYGALYQDLYIKECNTKNNIVYRYTVPSSKKNFNQVDTMSKEAIQKAQQQFTNGLCLVEYYTDLITKDNKKVTCHVKLNSDRIAMNETVTLPSNEFCK